jgi:hypothetical protein
MVFFDGRGPGHLRDRHPGDAPQNIVGLAFVRRREVQHDHERHARIPWHVFKESDQGLNAACRCTNADDRKIERRSRTRRCRLIARSMNWLFHLTKKLR